CQFCTAWSGRRGFGSTAVQRNVQRQCGGRAGEYDHDAARLRNEQQGDSDFRSNVGPPDSTLIMVNRFRLFLLCLVAIVLSGCALVPPEPVVTWPLTAAPPPPPMPMAQANGSIYQPTAYGSYPLFEDRRPHKVGDIVTNGIRAKSNGAKNVQHTTDRSGSAGFGVQLDPAMLPPDFGAKQNFVTGGNNATRTKGSTRAV